MASSSPGRHYLDGHWSREDVYIVGGGPSLIGADLSWLDGKRAIAVNYGVAVWPHADILYGQDLAMWTECVPSVGYRGLVVTSFPAPPENYRGVAMDPTHELVWPRSFADPMPIFAKSGTGAIAIADMLGAGMIFLLGFDGRGPSSRVSHSGRFPPASPEHQSRDRYRDAARHIEEMRWASYHASAQIVNLSLGSSLDMFPVVSRAVPYVCTACGATDASGGSCPVCEIPMRDVSAMCMT